MFLSKQRQSRFKVIHIMRSLSLATLSRKKGGVTLSKSSCRTTLSLLWENYSSGSRTPPEKKAVLLNTRFLLNCSNTTDQHYAIKLVTCMFLEEINGH